MGRERRSPASTRSSAGGASLNSDNAARSAPTSATTTSTSPSAAPSASATRSCSTSAPAPPLIYIPGLYGERQPSHGEFRPRARRHFLHQAAKGNIFTNAAGQRHRRRRRRQSPARSPTRPSSSPCRRRWQRRPRQWLGGSGGQPGHRAAARSRSRRARRLGGDTAAAAAPAAAAARAAPATPAAAAPAADPAYGADRPTTASSPRPSSTRLVDAAIQRWIDAGATAAQVAAMRAVEFGVVDMAGIYVGTSTDGVIKIDSDGAGFGWFVDSDPGRGQRVRRLRHPADRRRRRRGRGQARPADRADARARPPDRPRRRICDVRGRRVDVRLHECRRAPPAGRWRGRRRGARLGRSTAFALTPVSVGTLPSNKAVDVFFKATIDNQFDKFIGPLMNTAHDQRLATSPTSSPSRTIALDSLTLGSTVYRRRQQQRHCSMPAKAGSSESRSALCRHQRQRRLGRGRRSARQHDDRRARRLQLRRPGAGRLYRRRQRGEFRRRPAARRTAVIGRRRRRSRQQCRQRR